MKRIIFTLVMLFCPNLFAATLTTNTIPYVCQGGASPQLCSSNITTDSNGNANMGFGTWQAASFNQVYQAATDGFLVGSVYLRGGSAGSQSGIATFYTGSNNPPSTNPSLTANMLL